MIPDLWREARGLMAELDAELERYRTSGAALAENERAYRAALAKETLFLREDGVPVTVIGDIAKGSERIADLRCARDCSQAVFDASGEALNVLKLKLRVVNDEMGREWNSGSDGL